jgi:HEAT repeat protein
MSRPGQQLYAIVQTRVTPLLTRALQSLAPLSSFIPQPIQRLGDRAMKRVLRRFGVLAELLGQAPPRTRVVDAQHAQRAVRVAGPVSSPVAVAPIVPIDPEPLLVQLETERAWQRRAAAARALGEHDAPRAISGLVNALRDTSAEVAAAAAGSLGQQRDPRAVTALRAVVDNVDRFYNSATRAAAITALASRKTDLEPVFDAVRDMDAEVSVAAVFAILEFMPQAAAKQLMPVLKDRSGYFLPLVRVAALHALTRTGTLTSEMATELLQSEQDGDVKAALTKVIG